ncbi:MAG: SIMPL domain-containing protein [Chloroflexi bacterium]|nr:SIMPL domain-containing protein [Chloroflexota bacterium]OJV90233.1 MAG: hypothetical protein BGO39_02425 [Chloroflexi bacterium 54-19]
MRPKIFYGVVSVAILVVLAGTLLVVALLVNRPAAATPQAAVPTPTLTATPMSIPTLTPTPALTSQAQVPAGETTPAPNPNKIITITSVGQVKVVPDVAYLNVGSEIQAPTATEAMAKAGTTSEAIYNALIAEGVTTDTIQTSGINVYPVNDPTAITKGPNGYRASFTYYVTISEIGNAGKILDSVTNAGANQISGLSYGIKDDTGYRVQALEKAIQLARPKADAIARSLGTEITQVLTVQEVQGSYYSPSSAYGLGGKTDASTGVTIAPGALTVSVQVSISYGFR